MRNKIKILIISAGVSVLLFLGSSAVAGDFRLTPAKIEITVNAGEVILRDLFIENRLGYDAIFKVEVEDFYGSANGEEASILSGNIDGPYSLRNFIDLLEKEFTLKNGEIKILSVKIAIPESTAPGGLYAAVLVSPLAGETDKPVSISNRIGALFFVKVLGDVQQSGALEKFELTDNVFSIDFKNRGNVHLNPYGVIKIFDIFGRQIDEIKIDPYYALPGALRNRKINWQGFDGLVTGRYKAELSLNRGYGDIIDKAEAILWVNPLLIIMVAIVVLLLLVFFVWMLVNLTKRSK